MVLLNDMRNAIKTAWLIAEELATEEMVSKEEARLRLQICKACTLQPSQVPDFSGTESQVKGLDWLGKCNVCGCIMRVKTKMKFDPVESEKQGRRVLCACPVGKW